MKMNPFPAQQDVDHEVLAAKIVPPSVCTGLPYESIVSGHGSAYLVQKLPAEADDFTVLTNEGEIAILLNVRLYRKAKSIEVCRRVRAALEPAVIPYIPIRIFWAPTAIVRKYSERQELATHFAAVELKRPIEETSSENEEPNWIHVQSGSFR